MHKKCWLTINQSSDTPGDGRNVLVYDPRMLFVVPPDHPVSADWRNSAVVQPVVATPETCFKIEWCLGNIEASMVWVTIELPQAFHFSIKIVYPSCFMKGDTLIFLLLFLVRYKDGVPHLSSWFVDSAWSHNSSMRSTFFDICLFSPSTVILTCCQYRWTFA